MKYSEDCIEYCYINNVKQLLERLYFIVAKERAGNNNFYNEKLGILHLCNTNIEKLIDSRKGTEYLLQYVISLPKETTTSLE